MYLINPEVVVSLAGELSCVKICNQLKTQIKHLSHSIQLNYLKLVNYLKIHIYLILTSQQKDLVGERVSQIFFLVLTPIVQLMYINAVIAAKSFIEKTAIVLIESIRIIMAIHVMEKLLIILIRNTDCKINIDIYTIKIYCFIRATLAL